MTDETQGPTIGNVTEIIERFGGIRPMANKMGVPVTTVQGWKQRNAIPMNRRDDIIQAATANGIDLGDLLIGITAGAQSSPRPDLSQQKPAPPRPGREVYETHVPRESYTKPLFYAGVLILMGAAIGGVFAVAPKVRTMTAQEQQIKELQAQLEKERQVAEEKQAGSILPDGMQKSLTDLQSKVADLSHQAEGYSTAIEDLKTGTVAQRIAKLEGHMNQALAQANISSLSSMLQKVQIMQQSPQGTTSLSGVVGSMLKEIETAPQGKGDISTTLAGLRDSDPAVAQALEGVAPEDMKAAAMLIAMSQMRQSLARNNDSFDQDLALLKMTAARDNPELQDAIDRLAPQARNGVLTPDGLSQEFRGLAGDLVVASLSGENVSIEEKLKARLNGVMIVEKGGKQISGTQTQQTIAVAQKQLDEGHIDQAVATLQTLEGPAAEKAQPFISEAQATIAARQMQQLLGQNIIQQLKNTRISHDGVAVNTTGLNGLISQVEGMLPGVGTFTDKDSGYSIYVPPPHITLPQPQKR